MLVREATKLAVSLSGELCFVTTWSLGCSKACVCVCVCPYLGMFSSAYLVPGGYAELTGTWQLPFTTFLLATVPSVVSRYLNGNLLGEGHGCPLAKIQISRPPPSQSRCLGWDSSL